MPINEFIIKQDVTYEQIGEWTIWSYELGWKIEHYDMRSPISTDSKRQWIASATEWLNSNCTGRWTGQADLDLSRIEVDFENSNDAVAFGAALKDDEIC